MQVPLQAPPVSDQPILLYLYKLLLLLLLLFLLFVLAALRNRVNFRHQLRRERERERQAAVRQRATKRRQAAANAGPTSQLAPSTEPIEAALVRLSQLHEDRKFLDAGKLLDALRARLAIAKGGAARAAATELERMLAAGGACHGLEGKVHISREALTALNDDSGWSFLGESDGARMQRRDEGDNLLVKIDAVLEGVRPVDTLKIWREASLYPTWFPLATGGFMLKERDPANIVAHIEFSQFFGVMDLVLEGWSCDHTTDGCFLFCVRSVRAKDVPDVARYPPHPAKAHPGKPMAVRILAKIDILFEPLSPTSVRFCFLITQPIPPNTPRWIVTYVLQKGMSQIFRRMRQTAAAMSNTAKQSPHRAHYERVEYKRVNEYWDDKINSYLTTLGAA